MKILVVDDDENKLGQIVTFLSEKFPLAKIVSAQSLQSGLRIIISNELSLIILDMSMPTFDVSVDEDGGRIQAYAGREILRQMDRREIEAPVVIVTQFEKFGEGADELTLTELDGQLRTAHSTIYKGSVYYDVSMEGWKEALMGKIAEVQLGA